MLAKIYWENGHLKGVPFALTITIIVIAVLGFISMVARRWAGRARRVRSSPPASGGGVRDVGGVWRG
jgi:hypothetical protein